MYMLPTSEINQCEASHLPMQAWLDMLRVVLPIRGVLVVGAGLGNGPWVQWLKGRHVSTVHLVEGDERQYRHLTSSLLPIDGWTSWRDVVAASTDPVTFYQASNPAESGLIEPETLQQFWPHLETERSVTVDSAVTLDSLSAETNFAINWLILDCLPASELLQGGIKLLDKIDVALVRVAQGEGETLKTACHDAADSVLCAAGLTCCHVQPERHSVVAHALYVRDMRRQVQIAQERLQQANDLLKQEKLILEERCRELERTRIALEQDKQILIKQSKNIEKFTSENTSYFDKIISQVQTQSTQIEQIAKSLKQQIDSGLKNSVKQIEFFIGIESYLVRGNLALPMHGWPISADFAMNLIEMIERQNYDLIIEFGSGSSTVLMAKVLCRMDMQRNQSAGLPMEILEKQECINLKNKKIIGSISNIENIKVISAAVRSVIISFEHNKKYYDETLMRLHQEGVEKFVELLYSPLRNYISPDNKQFLYYACEEKFLELAKALEGSRARILVVVDGPPGSINPHARYPAMPILLQYLASHQIDVLLDDSNRKEEKEIINFWTELLKQRSLAYEMKNLAFEKGACLLSIR